MHFQKNLKETAEIVHKIKHKISILGLNKSKESAELLSINLKIIQRILINI